jgi:cytochrome c oxidase cbb3-type subunit 3
MPRFARLYVLVAALGASVSCLAAAANEHAAVAAVQFPADLVESGRKHFATDCGFCHGRDATGGSKGADLTRSELVARDVGGDLIGEAVRRGRADKGMPAFASLGKDELSALTAFIHSQKQLVDSANGGRRSVEPEDLAGGSVEAGLRYFQTNCQRCHSATGDLAGIGLRLKGLPLLRRMLGPEFQRRSPAKLTVTSLDGRRFVGALDFRDEFTVAMRDDSGIYRSWPTRAVSYTVDDPLQAHVDQLARYTDEAMHDVLAYLQSLR